ncbi:MAG TPA: nucleoside-triphosphatase [Bryobacteraceae bacterium]|nr:nucleoside-triphosphatase [Bryobacteraceae bacterium]
MSTNVANPVPSLRPGPAARGIWNRAAVLGSLWAAFEIVGGSFLHNLRIPFAGTILAVMGVVLVLSAVQVWNERGLVWRAALICALMKSISPSAVILGPMIGIASEGLIMQAVLAVLGRGWLSCMAAGALAVSWTLAQKILNLLITYGPDFVALYSGMVKFAAKSTGWSGLDPAGLVWSLLAVQACAGAAAGLAGWRLGQRISLSPTQPDSLVHQRSAAATSPALKRQEHPFSSHSLTALALLAAALISGLWLMPKAGLGIAASISASVVALVLLRYHRGFGKLRRPRFWLELMGVFLLSGLLLGQLSGESNASWAIGLRAGAEMAVRAIFVVVMFSAISIEMRNPRIVAWLSRGRFAEASRALGAAFEALPDFIAAMPDFSTALRNPAKGLAALLQLAHTWEDRFATSSPGIILITGERGSGKTTLLMETAGILRRQGVAIRGIVSPGTWANGARESFEVMDVASGESHPLARRSDQPAPVRRGPYAFDEGGLAFGRRSLERCGNCDPCVMFIDEVGPIELDGGGWADQLNFIRQRRNTASVWVVRPNLVEAVSRRWNLIGARVLDASRTSPGDLARILEAQADGLAPDGANALHP